MATTIRYETKTCGRCGGTGHFSYNAMTGTRCFGCNGGKVVLTPKGHKAFAAVTAWKAANWSVPVESLAAGTRVELRGTSKSGKVTLTEGAHSHYPRLSRGWSMTNGVKTESPEQVRISFALKDAMGRVTPHGYVMGEGSTVVLAPTPEMFADLVAFARTLKGVIIEEAVAA